MTEPPPRAPFLHSQPGQTWKVPESSKGQRVDIFLRDRLGISRARLNEIFRAKGVRLDGKPVRKGDALEAGQIVRVDWREQEEAILPEPNGPLAVLYSDAALVFVDKPAGMPSHPLRPGERGTVANALVARFPECARASRDWREGGLCHRLDAETSGVLLAARDSLTWREMREAFKRRIVEKHYWALVTGPIADEGEIDLPLRHSKGTPGRVIPSQQGREARSSFYVRSRKKEYSLIEVVTRTGVLHQVRAHLAAIGAPIVGDALYGGRPEQGLERFFLHARTLQLGPPIRPEPLKVESPLPSELRGVLARLQMPSPSVGGFE